MKKKTAVGVGLATVITAAGIATNLLVTPEELLRTGDTIDASHVEKVAADFGEQSITYTEPGALSAKDAVRARIIHLPLVFKVLVLLPLWAVGALPVALGTALAGTLSPIGAQLLSFVAQAGVLIGVFCLVYKLLFPNKSVKTLFKKKNFRWLLLGAVAVTGVNLLLGIAWPQWSVWRTVLFVLAGAGVLGLLWYRLCGKLKAPRPKEKQTKLLLSYNNA